MSLNQTQISSLYVALFGRASEGAGNDAWVELSNKNPNLTMADVAKTMLDTPAAKEFFGNSLDSNKAFIYHIYKTTLNKDTDVDVEGKAGWIARLDSGIVDRAKVVEEILKAAVDPVHSKSADPVTKDAHNTLINKIIASNVVANSVKNVSEGNLKDTLKDFQFINDSIKASTTKDEIKKILEAKKDDLKIDLAKADKALSDNGKLKAITELTGLSKEKVEEQIGKDSDNDNPGNTPDKPNTPDKGNSGNSDEIVDTKPQYELKALDNSDGSAEGFFIKFVDKNDSKEFIVIETADNNLLKPLEEGDKVFFEQNDGRIDSVVRAKDGSKLKFSKFFVEEFSSSNKLDDVEFTRAITKDGIYFTQIGSATSYKDSLKGAVYNEKDGLFEKDGVGVVGSSSVVKNVLQVDPAVKGVYFKYEPEDIYYLSNKVPLKGELTIEISNWRLSKFKFLDQVTNSLTEAQDENSLVPNAKQFVKDGDNLILYVSDGDADFDSNKDLKITFKGVKLESTDAKDGFFNFAEVDKKEGVEKISDFFGFAQIFDDTPSIKIKDVDSIYKDADGKFYKDAAGTKEINVSANIDVKAVQIAGGEFIYATAKSLNKDAIKSLNNLQDRINSADPDDVLELHENYTKYKFAGSKKIKEVESRDFKFVNKDNNSELTFDQAKKITKDAFLKGELPADNLQDGATIRIYKYQKAPDDEYTLNANGEVKDFSGSLDKVKELLEGKIKIVDEAITKINGDKVLNASDLDFLKSKMLKLKDDAIEKVDLSADEAKELNSTPFINKIKDGAINLTDTKPLTLEQLKDLKDENSKLMNGTIKAVDTLNVDDLKAVFGPDKIDYAKVADGQINLVDTPSNISDTINNDDDFTTNVAKIGKISASENTAIEISVDKFKTFKDKLDPTQDIKLLEVTSTDKDLLKADNVKGFTLTMGQTLDIKADEFVLLTAKNQTKPDGDNKFNLVDTKANIDTIIDDSQLGENIVNIKFTDETLTIDTDTLAKFKALTPSVNPPIVSIEMQDKSKVVTLSDNVANLKSSLADFKSFDISDKKVINVAENNFLELTKDEFTDLDFSANSDIRITDAKGNIAATMASETFKVENANVTDLAITKFGANDKIDFTGIDTSIKTKGDLAVAETAALKIENGKIYLTTSENSKTTAGAEFATNLVANSDKAFSDQIEMNTKAVVIVKVVDVEKTYKVFKIDNSDNTTLEADDIKLVGTVRFDDANASITDANLVLA